MTNRNKDGNGKPPIYFTPRIIVMELVFWSLLTVGLYAIAFRNWFDALVIGTVVYGAFVGRNVWKHRRENRRSPSTPET